MKAIGLEGRQFSSHGLRRTANDLLRRVATGEVTRAIVGHMTPSMTGHYSHVDVGEKRQAQERVLRLVADAAGTQEEQPGTRSGIDACNRHSKEAGGR